MYDEIRRGRGFWSVVVRPAQGHMQIAANVHRMQTRRVKLRLKACLGKFHGLTDQAV
jgi:hypothetical protein